MAWFRQRNSSLRWNFSFKFHVHVLCGCRQKPNDCQLCCFQNGCLVILNNVQLQSTHCPLPPFPIGFFGFRTNFSLALNINSKLKWHYTYIYGQEPIDFQGCHFQNGRLVAMLDFLVSGLTLVWLWISTPNFSGKILMYIGKSLLIFSDLIFLMAAWWPY